MKLCDRQGGKRVLIVGVGAVGSHLVGLIARAPDVKSLVLVDNDTYEESNLTGQDITRSDIGLAKASVQAKRAGGISANLDCAEIVGRIEDVPPGIFSQANVVLTAVDNRAARQYVGSWCWRLGTPLIDSGVLGDGLLARVSAYIPSEDGPCIECGWAEADYELLEQVYPCGRMDARGTTDSPPYLSAAAAALQAAECAKLLSGGHLSSGRQFLLDMSSHCTVTTDCPRNDSCRFDHTIWDVHDLKETLLDLPVREVLGNLFGTPGGSEPAKLTISDKPFTTQLTCPDCRTSRAIYRLDGRIGQTDTVCWCGSAMISSGFSKLSSLEGGNIPEDMGEMSLRMLGIRRGDVLTLSSSAGERHFVVQDERRLHREAV